MKHRHHYVSRFYLQAFASAPKRIHIFNLKRERGFEHGSLRDQCYSHRLYGDTDELEDAFGKLEGQVASVIHRVASTHQPPEPGSPDYVWLLSFVVLQMLRTTGARDRIQRSSTAFTKKVFDHTPPPAGFVPNQDESLVLSLRNLGNMTAGLDGLRMHTIIAPAGGEFITSDNPVYRYNQYCEGILWSGVTGALCKGLQVFLPLTPRVSLLLFDGGVYKVGKRGVAPCSQATHLDLEFLNRIQLLAAVDNVYFSNWSVLKNTERLAVSVQEERKKNRSRVFEAFEVGNDRSSLIHQYEQMPNLELRLSFITLRRAARRVPLQERARLYRKRLPPYEMPDYAVDDSRPRVFETRSPR